MLIVDHVVRSSYYLISTSCSYVDLLICMCCDDSHCFSSSIIFIDPCPQPLFVGVIINQHCRIFFCVPSSVCQPLYHSCVWLLCLVHLSYGCFSLVMPSGGFPACLGYGSMLLLCLFHCHCLLSQGMSTALGWWRRDPNEHRTASL